MYDYKMEDMRIYDKRECHWRMVLEYNNGGVDNEKYILHAKSWDAYTDKKILIIKGGYYV